MPRDIPKMSRTKSCDFRTRFRAIYSASNTRKYLLKISRLTIVFFLKNIEANTGRITHPGKLELVARSTSEEFILKIPKQFED